MQLVKEELEKSSSSPRWTYKIGSVYIKTIPFANGTDDIDKQIALINDVVNHELVLGHEIITLDTEWDTEKSKLWNKNKYLKYAINEIEGSVADPRLYCKIHTLMENSDNEEKTIKKIQSLKDKEVEALLFKKYITINNNKAQNNRMITDFFS